MNQNPIIKSLREELAKERNKLAQNDWNMHNGCLVPAAVGYIEQSLIKHGHEAATARLLTIIEKAVEMAEFYAQEGCEVSVRIGDPPYDGWQLIGDGKKAREFLLSIRETASGETTLADASGELNKDEK